MKYQISRLGSSKLLTNIKVCLYLSFENVGQMSRFKVIFGILEKVFFQESSHKVYKYGILSHVEVCYYHMLS